MKILFLANNDVGLYKFRKELIQELINSNNQVIISLPSGEYVQHLIDMGCMFVDTKIDRRGTNPIRDFNLVMQFIKTIKMFKPDVVLTYTIKPNIYGGVACRLTKTPYIANVTGLGTSIENQGLMQKIILVLYKIGLSKSNCVFFQNQSNWNYFIEKNILNGRSRLIPGSGVNLNQHSFEEYPEEDKMLKFTYIGRIMKSKGISELLEVAERIKKTHSNVEFDIIGFIEEKYKNQLEELNNKGIINYLGQQDDVHSFIKNSHAIILPSYHEGISNVLLESSAVGRPVLASNVAGCIETFDEGISGFGFTVKNADSLYDVIEKFIKLPYDTKKKMGFAARRKMEDKYNRRIVVNAYVEEINRAMPVK
ncbi:MAG: glycosyltransferase family 4 protein [Saccharofermentanales bacterium]